MRTYWRVINKYKKQVVDCVLKLRRDHTLAITIQQEQSVSSPFSPRRSIILFMPENDLSIKEVTPDLYGLEHSQGQPGSPWREGKQSQPRPLV